MTQNPSSSPSSSLSQPVFCLPLLHAALEMAAVVLPPAAVRLWPGLPGMPEGYWVAASYPFTPAAAQDCARQLESLSEAALSGVPMQTLAQMDATSAARRTRQELHDIDAFARNGDAPLASDPEAPRVLQAAQKALLWAWLLEEKVLEVKKIMSTYMLDAPHLMDALGVEEDEDDKSLSLLASLDRNLDSTSLMLPPWSMVLENASLFLPNNACLAVSGLMAADLRDRLTFSPATVATRALWALDADSPVPLDEARAPLWQALGKSSDSGDGQPWRTREFTFVLAPKASPKASLQDSGIQA